MKPLLAAALLFGMALGSAGAQEWTAPLLDQLVVAAEHAPAEGLPLEIARIERLRQLRAAGRAGYTAAMIRYEIDAEASALFARLAQDFAAGRVRPQTVDADWHILPKAPAIDALRKRALESGDLLGTLAGLLPQHEEYRALKDEYERVRSENGQPSNKETDRQRRSNKLRASLERWRWLPRELPPRRIEVHVPEFHLVLMQDDTVLRTHKAIVGKSTTRTPSFAARIESVTFNPYWVPPASILFSEIVPKLRRDPNYASRAGFEIIGPDGRIVDSHLVDWARDAARYHVRQRPGPDNALGRAKFDMPNPYGIYLHDTPALNLFERLNRSFSHGCIRVQEALILAHQLLGDDLSDLDLYGFALSTRSRTKLWLTEPVPVFVLYLTAGRGEHGKIVYVDDLYKRDTALIAALDAAEAAAAPATQH